VAAASRQWPTAATGGTGGHPLARGSRQRVIVESRTICELLLLAARKVSCIQGSRFPPNGGVRTLVATFRIVAAAG